MGQVSSAFDPDPSKNTTAPTGYVVPKFPSLYNPSLTSTIEQRGFFLHDAYAIWKFTFYWTLILLFGIFTACAALASVNLLLSRAANKPHNTSPTPAPTDDPAPRRLSRFATRRRPPLWLIALIPVTMGATATFVALVSGTVVGFALAAVYSAAGFSMSTWVPFMWALIQVVVIIISSYSSLTRVL